MKKRIFSILVTLSMLCAMLPTVVSANAVTRDSLEAAVAAGTLVNVAAGKSVTLPKSGSQGTYDSAKARRLVDNNIRSRNTESCDWVDAGDGRFGCIDLGRQIDIKGIGVWICRVENSAETLTVWGSNTHLTNAGTLTEANADLLATFTESKDGYGGAAVGSYRYIYITGGMMCPAELKVYADKKTDNTNLLAGLSGLHSDGTTVTGYNDEGYSESNFGAQNLKDGKWVRFDLGIPMDLHYFSNGPVLTQGTEVLYWQAAGVTLKASNTPDFDTATTLIHPFDIKDSGGKFDELWDIQGNYQYVWIAGTGPTGANAYFDNVKIYGKDPRTYMFGDWNFANDNTTITAENTVKYLDQNNQDTTFMLFATNYDSDGNMIGDMQIAAIPFDKTNEVHQFGASFASSMDVDRTQFVLVSTDDQQSALNLAAPIVYYDWTGGTWSGFNAEKGTATAFNTANVSVAKNAEYPFTSVSATISGKSVAKDDLIEVIVEPATATTALVPGQPVSGFTYHAFVESKNGYEINIPFTQAGNYNITVVRYSATGMEILEEDPQNPKGYSFGFSFPDPDDVQDAINAFFEDGANYADAIDEAVNGVGIVGRSDLISYDAFASQDFATVAPLFGVIEQSQSLRDPVTDDIVISRTEDLTEILNTVLAAYELSKGNTAVMENYGDLITGDADVKTWVEANLGYSVTADINCQSNRTNLTNVGAKGIIEFTFTEAMKPSTLTSANVVLTRGGEVDTYTVAYATENGFAIDLSSLNANENYTLTFKSGCKTAGNKSMLKEKKFDFSTGDILNLPYKEGKVLKNVALGKEFVNHDAVEHSQDDELKNDISVILDGDRTGIIFASFKSTVPPIIDLGAYYSPVAVRITARKTDWPWQFDEIDFQGTAKPLSYEADGITPTAECFDTTTGAGVKFHSSGISATATAQDDKIVPVTGAEALAAFGPIRYVRLNKAKDTFLKEIEIYAYVDVVVGPIKVDNTNAPAENESYTFTASIEDYEAADTDPYMIALAYDENGKVVDIDVAAATEPQVSATVTATAETKGITAMVVEDLSTMALIADPVTVGTAPASTSASANGVAIDSTVDEISFSVKADDNISQNTAYSAFVIREDGSIFGDTVAEAFERITASNLETADILFATAAKVGTGAKYEVAGTSPDQSYFINVVANGKEKVVKQRKQKLLGQSAKDTLINNVTGADESTVVTAIEAILADEAISKEDINDYDALAGKLQDPRFPQMLVDAIAEIEGPATFETIADAINDAQAALRKDDEKNMMQDVLDATTTSGIKDAIKKVVYDEEIVPEDLIDDYDSLQSNLTVTRFQELLLEKADGVTSPTPEAMAKIINDAQAALLEELKDAIIDPVLDATSADAIATAVESAVWQAPGSKTTIPEELLYNKVELATLLSNTNYKKALLYAKDMLKAQGSFKPSLKAIADITNAARAVYALDTCNTTNQAQRDELTKLWKGNDTFEGYGDLFGNSFASGAKMIPMTQIYQAKSATVQSGATLANAIKWSSALSALSGASNKDAAKAFKDYSSIYGIDTKAVKDANVSYEAIATYFERGDLLSVYGTTAFNNEFTKALNQAKDINKDVTGSIPEEGEFGTLTGGVETGGGGGGGGSDEPKPTTKPTPTPAPKSGFSDMKNFAWAEEAVANLVAEGVINGNEKGEFEPSRSVTRGEFVKMLVVASKIKVDESKAMHFADVPNSSWQHPYVQIAYSRGLCRGTEEYLFNVNGTITRQDMAVMLTNLLNYLGVNSSGDAIEFTDAQKVADYAISAVETATKAGLINGFDDGSFKPRESTRRVDAAMVISKLLELL